MFISVDVHVHGGVRARILPLSHAYPSITLPHITHLTAKPSRMIGVQVGVWARAYTRNTHINTYKY